MPLTASDITRLENLFTELKNYKSPTDSSVTSKPSDSGTRRGYDFVLMNIQLRRFARELAQLTQQLAQMQLFDKEVSDKIAQVGQVSSDLVTQVSSLQFNVNLYQRGGFGRGTAILQSVTSGISRGLDAASMTKTISEQIKSGEIRFGSDLDRQEYVTREWGRILLAMFGIRV